MKKIITFLFLTAVLTSCGSSQSEIDSAKQELLGPPESIQDDREPVLEDESANEKASSPVQIIPLDADSPLSFDEIPESSLTTGEVIISGKAGPEVDKVEVFFTNPTSKYPDDRYVLQRYEKGKGIFSYKASSKNQVLDFGQNEYIFRAYSGTSENDTKIILAVASQDQEETKGSETTLIGEEDNFVTLNLPTSSKYGEPMKLGEASFTYTQIKGLEINKEALETVSCETLTDYLTERMTSWYYWNTCRNIVKDKGIKFNVIRLEGDRYVYERHYVDFVHGFYGVYELETGEGVTQENIADKNQELKEREYPSLEIVDDLMRDINNS